MADIEKVIKGLEHCNCHKPLCRECPYITEDMTDENETQCFDVLSKDALALLKEQEERIETLESLRRIEQECR